MSCWSVCLLVALAAVAAAGPYEAEGPILPVPLPKPVPSPAPEPAPIPAPIPASILGSTAAAIDPAPYLVCSTCGRFSGLISALLQAVFNLLLALLGNVNIALCYTLYLVYILLCIIQVTVANEVSIAVSGLILILQRVALLPVVGNLLRTIGLLLTGLLGCLLRVLGVALVL